MKTIIASTIRNAGFEDAGATARPRAVRFDGAALKAVIRQGQGNWVLECRLPRPGTMTLRF